MELAFMRFCGKPFAQDLTDVKISVDRDVTPRRLCSGKNLLQDKGTRLKTVSGSGELNGNDAAEKAEYMRSVFYAGKSGALIMPQNVPMYALLLSLTFSAEADDGSVAYKFEFCEQPRGRAPTPLIFDHTVEQGENLWTIARAYGVTVEELMRLNPQIARPDRLKRGEEVKIRWK